MKQHPVSRSNAIMTQLVLPSHTNPLDGVFGGVIMSWIDMAGAISAQRHCNRPVVTANIDDLHFVAPVYTGWIVNLKACVNFVHKTSMEVGVRVDAENSISHESFHTATAYLTFVALDDNGKPMIVPKLAPESDEENRRFKDGELRRKIRLEKRARIQASRNS